MGKEDQEKSESFKANRKSLEDFRLSIRPMKFEEIETTAKLFSSVGLNDSVPTLETFYEYDPAGFWVAIDEDNDRVIGSCATPMTTHKTCFLGLYVVDPSYQGLGIGVRLFNRCLEKVGDGNCGLSAIPSKFKIYKDKAGFQMMEGRSMVIIEGKPDRFGDLKTMADLDQNRYRLMKLTNLDYEEKLAKKIIKFDQTVHLDNRSKLLEIMFKKPMIIILAVIEKCSGSGDEDGDDPEKVVGYGTIQLDVIDRAMIGPLYAKDALIGEVLMAELIRSESKYYQNNHLVYFTMDNSFESLRLTKDVLGLHEITRCEKLYTKFIPPFNYDYLFCCHTPDFSC